MQVLPTNWASVHSNHGYISVSTSSGYRACALDLNGEHIVLSENCSDEELANALLAALDESRVLSVEEIPEFFNASKVESRYEKWVDNLLKKFGGMSRRKAFAKMKHCNVVVLSNKLKFRPNKKERGEAWSGKGFTELDNVELPYESTPKEIGAALKMVLSKCK